MYTTVHLFTTVHPLSFVHYPFYHIHRPCQPLFLSDVSPLIPRVYGTIGGPGEA